MTETIQAKSRSSRALNLSGAFVRRTDLSHANLQRANLSRADFTNAIFRGADLKNAILNRTILKGADLRDVINLTAEQLAEAIIDNNTKLPVNLRRS